MCTMRQKRLKIMPKKGCALYTPKKIGEFFLLFVLLKKFVLILGVHTTHKITVNALVNQILRQSIPNCFHRIT